MSWDVGEGDSSSTMNGYKESLSYRAKIQRVTKTITNKSQL